MDDRTQPHPTTFSILLAREKLKSISSTLAQLRVRTPLHLVSGNGYVEIAKLLLERGADHHVRDIDGRTPYRLAMKSGNLETEQMLLRLLSA